MALRKNASKNRMKLRVFQLCKDGVSPLDTPHHMPARIANGLMQERIGFCLHISFQRGHKQRQCFFFHGACRNLVLHGMIQQITISPARYT